MTKLRPRWWPTAAIFWKRRATQFELHAQYGGVVPEIAARRHLENILPVTQAALDQAGVSLKDIDGLAVTQGPGLIGALVIGMAVGKALAYTLKKPLVECTTSRPTSPPFFLRKTTPIPLRGPGGLRRAHQPLPRQSLRICPHLPQPGRRRGRGL